MHKVRVFLNHRASSQEKAQDQLELIKRRLFRSEIEMVAPDSFDSLKSELKRAIDDQVDVVVSVGGDGTVNTLIQELAGSKTAFLIVPAGTANDLAREMGLNRRIEKAVETIRSSSPELIDLIQVNQRYMVTNGGIGIASDVASRVNFLRAKFPIYKKIMSLLHERVYSVMLGYEVLIPALKFYEVEIESAEFSDRIRTPLLMINNQAALGGKFRIAPQTENDDGTFNVSLFLHQDKKSFIEALSHIRFKHCPRPDDKNFISFETKSLKLRSYTSLSFYGDGETFETNNQFEISIKEKSLRVYGARTLTATHEGGVKE